MSNPKIDFRILDSPSSSDQLSQYNDNQYEHDGSHQNIHKTSHYSQNNANNNNKNDQKMMRRSNKKAGSIFNGSIPSAPSAPSVHRTLTVSTTDRPTMQSQSSTWDSVYINNTNTNQFFVGNDIIDLRVIKHGGLSVLDELLGEQAFVGGAVVSREDITVYKHIPFEYFEYFNDIDNDIDDIVGSKSDLIQDENTIKMKKDSFIEKQLQFRHKYQNIYRWFRFIHRLTPYHIKQLPLYGDLYLSTSSSSAEDIARFRARYNQSNSDEYYTNSYSSSDLAFSGSSSNDDNYYALDPHHNINSNINNNNHHHNYDIRNINNDHGIINNTNIISHSLNEFSDSSREGQDKNNENLAKKNIEHFQQIYKECTTILFDIQTNSPNVIIDELIDSIRNVERETLVWAQSHEVLPVAFGIMKLRIGATFRNVSVDSDDLIDELSLLPGVGDLKVIAFQKA